MQFTRFFKLILIFNGKYYIRYLLLLFQLLNCARIRGKNNSSPATGPGQLHHELGLVIPNLVRSAVESSCLGSDINGWLPQTSMTNHIATHATPLQSSQSDAQSSNPNPIPIPLPMWPLSICQTRGRRVSIARSALESERNGALQRSSAGSSVPSGARDTC